jgi:hypothetical protein
MLTKLKIRSKKLLEHLIVSGALEQGNDAIVQAKKLYRQQYKRDWKKRKLMLSRELRISLTLREYCSLRITAHNNGLSCTKFARQQLLNAIHEKPCILNPEILRDILQSISLSINDGRTDRLQNAEKLLITYLKDGSG